MIDYILVGLISGLTVFLSLFIVSFVTLGLITGLKRFVSFFFNSLILGKPSTYQEQRA